MQIELVTLKYQYVKMHNRNQTQTEKEKSTSKLKGPIILLSQYKCLNVFVRKTSQIPSVSNQITEYRYWAVDLDENFSTLLNKSITPLSSVVFSVLLADYFY